MLDFIKKLSTSRNLTILGVLTILGALVDAGKAVVDGDPLTVVDWKVTAEAVLLGIGFIMAKGAASTSGNPATNTPPVP
jgi:hypothetical protein